MLGMGIAARFHLRQIFKFLPNPCNVARYTASLFYQIPMQQVSDREGYDTLLKSVTNKKSNLRNKQAIKKPNAKYLPKTFIVVC